MWPRPPDQPRGSDREEFPARARENSSRSGKAGPSARASRGPRLCPDPAGAGQACAVGRSTGIRADVHGIVQGVGFRPFVYRTAVSCGLHGDVRNAGGHVQIRVRGTDLAVERFLDRLVREAPPLARIDRIETAPCDDAGENGFRVLPSDGATSPGGTSPPDSATCPSLPARAVRPRATAATAIPFINCTACGPRFTIIARRSVRPRHDDDGGVRAVRRPAAPSTHDPADRRFHAEPIACPACGPRLLLDGRRGVARRRTRWPRRSRRSVAGGDRRGQGARRLPARRRRRRRRPRSRGCAHAQARADKPFAVMVGDLAAARATRRGRAGRARRC